MIRNRPIEWWIACVRVVAVPLMLIQVALTSNYPNGDKTYAWILLAVFALGSAALLAVVPSVESRVFGWLAMGFDFVVVSGYVILFAFDSGVAARQLLYLLVVEGAVRLGTSGGLGVAVASAPIALLAEWRHSDVVSAPFRPGVVAFQIGAELVMALIVGWVVARLGEERALAERRAVEAEGLRDQLGRRADLLDAANRCARALSSSLDLEEAFGEFIRQLRGLVPFDRMAIVLVEDGTSRVIATSGTAAEEIGPPGFVAPLEHNLLADLVESGQTAYRRDMVPPQYDEETWLVDEIGIRCRVVAPLLIGARVIGMISVGRRDPGAFEDHDVELMSLLGRLAASAVQNIRAYESERRTVEELRRLSALRADFVSLVSHELRSPMAAVIGAARTLEQRWRELTPEQREAFLALIGDETTRLAALIGDVLDTSRIDAGTFTYRFGEVDLVALVTDAVSTASVGQDEVPITVDAAFGVPRVRGDADRIRQVVANLIDNAVKYSAAGEPVDVRVGTTDHTVTVSVADRGPGIANEDQRLIFEKFGRVASGSSKPGTGLGLFIARSIAEAHGGTVEVSSSLGRGATFTLKLPLT
ncbi:MAG TPA: ATP-binding protein [Gaiellaceae bacterium]|nr:ATP-binding protein [Gaiellaceae bacterium]